MMETQTASGGIGDIIKKSLDFVIRLLGGASMVKFLIRRILAAIPVLFAIMLVTFTLSHLLPAGPFSFAACARRCNSCSRAAP